jgi:hypothetical protein
MTPEEKIIALLKANESGLDFLEIESRLSDEDRLSGRTLRNMLNALSDKRVLYRRRSVSSRGAGAPPLIYQHASYVPRQLTMFDGAELKYETREEVERESVEEIERVRDEKGREAIGELPKNVLEQIAEGHLAQDDVAAAILRHAPGIADADPVLLLLEYADWVVKDINAVIREFFGQIQGNPKKAHVLSERLEMRLAAAKNYFHQFWRLDSLTAGGKQIMYLPTKATDPKSASLDRAAAEKLLATRLDGRQIIELVPVDAARITAAVGTDASVADIYLDHVGGKFMRQDPVAVLNAAAAQHVRADEIGRYQDFDIFPEGLREYEAYPAAKQGLVISPTIREYLPEADFKHTRSAAMELRQYEEDFRVVNGQAVWRPIGDIPSLDGLSNYPMLIFRDGRMLPMVHRIKDFESSSKLYGQIVRNQIASFARVIHHVQNGPSGNIAYAATVKNPQQSWLAPLVFWYLHNKAVTTGGKLVIDADACYNVPFTDTAVSHLLFLGVLNGLPQEATRGKVVLTCRARRRFSDVAFAGEGRPTVPDGARRKPVNENDIESWHAHIVDRLNRAREDGRDLDLDARDYRPFLYLCANVHVAMFYAAPCHLYDPLVYDKSDAHFLLARLEVAGHTRDSSIEREALDAVLSWYGSGGCELDYGHAQDGVEVANPGAIPILVPDVILTAHEAVTFGRDYIGEEVEEALRGLIATLRRSSR